MAKVSIGEEKQFSDSRTTIEANKHNFKGDFALTTVESTGRRQGRRQGNPFEMKVTELNTDTTYGRILASFPTKVCLQIYTQCIILQLLLNTCCRLNLFLFRIHVYQCHQLLLPTFFRRYRDMGTAHVIWALLLMREDRNCRI